MDPLWVLFIYLFCSGWLHSTRVLVIRWAFGGHGCFDYSMSNIGLADQRRRLGRGDGTLFQHKNAKLGIAQTPFHPSPPEPHTTSCHSFVEMPNFPLMIVLLACSAFFVVRARIDLCCCCCCCCLLLLLLLAAAAETQPPFFPGRICPLQSRFYQFRLS